MSTPRNLYQFGIPGVNSLSADPPAVRAESMGGFNIKWRIPGAGGSPGYGGPTTPRWRQPYVVAAAAAAAVLLLTGITLVARHRR